MSDSKIEIVTMHDERAQMVAVELRQNGLNITIGEATYLDAPEAAIAKAMRQAADWLDKGPVDLHKAGKLGNHGRMSVSRT